MDKVMDKCLEDVKIYENSPIKLVIIIKINIVQKFK